MIPRRLSASSNALGPCEAEDGRTYPDATGRDRTARRSGPPPSLYDLGDAVDCAHALIQELVALCNEGGRLIDAGGTSFLQALSGKLGDSVGCRCGGDLMQIRRAEAADEEALASIRRLAILALAVPAMSRDQAERWAARGAADRVARAMREHDVWVAVEGAAVGWVEVDRDRVAALYVSPPCSRRGIGSILLTFAETCIRSSGHTTARLESSQNALDYYLRRGYLRCGPADSDGAWPLRKDLAAVTPDHSD